MRALGLALVLVAAGCSIYNDVKYVGDGGADHSVASDMVSDGGTTPDLVAPDLLPVCTSSATCPSDKPICDTASGVCRTCVVDTEDSTCAAKSAATPYCSATGICVECKQSGQCGTTKPVCSTAGACIACASSADDAICMARDTSKAHCEFTSGANLGQCVECAQSTQCPSAKPVCELTATDATRNQCRGCVAHSECGVGKLCDKGDVPGGTTTGQCVTPVVVDKTVDCKTSGAEAKPWCQIHQALAGEAAPSSGPLFLLVRGAAIEYDNFTIDSATPSKKVVIVGDASAALPIVNVTGVVGMNINFIAAATVNVVVENLQFGKATGGVRLNGAGVACTGTNATVETTLRNVTVTGVLSGPGIMATSCKVSVLQSSILQNEGGGLDVGGTSPTLLLVNSVVAANGKLDPSGSNVGGIRINAGTGKLINATVVDSRTKAGRYTGIDGDSADSVLGLNVVVAGGQGGTADIRSTTLGNSAFAAGASPTNGNKDIASCALGDILTDPSNGIYTPKASATATCTLIDAGAATFMTLSAPTVDRNSAVRPQGSAIEIGAYETP